MVEYIWSFGEYPYYKFTKTSSSHSGLFKYKGGSEISSGYLNLTESHLNLGEISIKISDIIDFRLVFLPSRRLIELELKPGYPEKYVFLANYHSMKGVMGGSFEMIYLFSQLCRLIGGVEHDYRLAFMKVDAQISYDKSVYYPGDKIKLTARIGKKLPIFTSNVEITVASNVSTWKSYGVIIQGHHYHEEYTSSHNYGNTCIEFETDRTERSFDLEYQLPDNLLYPMLNSYERPFEITHEITIRFIRKYLRDVYARFLIPVIPKPSINSPKPISASLNDITAKIEKDVVRSQEKVEIMLEAKNELIYDSIRLEFIRKITHRVYKTDPKKIEKVDFDRDTEHFSQEHSVCMSEVSSLRNFPVQVSIPNEVIPSFDTEPLVKFMYFIRVVFVKKLSRDMKIDIPITFYPNWKDFQET